MGLIKAKCTECGSALQVQEGSKKAKCPHCGSVFLVEDAVNNYNYTYNTTNNINADVVNVINKKDEFVIKGGILEQYLGESDTVEIPSSVKKIAGYKGQDGKYYGAFEGTGISKVTFPQSVVEVGPNAFKDCKFLKTVITPYELDFIDEYAFFGDENLDTLDINVKETVEGSFNGARCKQFNLTTDYVFTCCAYDSPHEDDPPEFWYLVADKATINANGIGMFYAGRNCEVTLAKMPSEVMAIEGFTLIVPNLDELCKVHGEYHFQFVKDVDGNELSQVVIDSDDMPRFLFPELKGLEVYTKKKAKYCPICGSEEISGLSHKCKKCNSKIIHGIKKAK